MSDALDAELLTLINKLYKIQAEVGGGKAKENCLANKNGKIDRFVDLKSQISERLENIKLLIEEVKKIKNDPQQIEAHARDDLGMVKQGEEYIEVAEQSNENITQ